MVWSPVLNLTYGWDVIEALGMLKDLPVVAVLVGDGSGRAQLETRAAALGVSERVRFLGHRPFESLPEILAACDVCVSTQTNDIVGRVRTTGKLPLYMASGRYVLASRVGEAARVLPAEMLLDYSGSVDREYPARMAARLRHLSADRARLGLGETLIDRARQEFAYDVLAPRVDAVVTGLLPVPVAVPA
jgi:glycosyltransferase involved in cell wall biosynthesis